MNISLILDNLVNWLLSSGMKILGIIILAFVSQLILKKIVKRIIGLILVSNHLKLGRKKRVSTLARIFIRTGNIIIWIIALIMILSELKINIAPILTGAGVVGLAVGFGARDLVANFINGLFILIEDQYAEGDRVKIAGIEGTVKKISLRTTILVDKEGVEHIIPNSSVKIVSNLSRKKD